jgi:hypothetical protein
MNKPTPKELFESCYGDSEKYLLMKSEVSELYDYENHIEEVYYRECDKTYWQVSYLKSPTGDHNELRDENPKIFQVFPYEITVTAYQRTRP